MEENKTPNKSEKEIIKENMLTLYKAHQEEEKNPVDEISYYKQIVLQSEKSPIMHGLQDVYPVKIKEPEKFYGNRVLLYQNYSYVITLMHFYILVKNKSENFQSLLTTLYLSIKIKATNLLD